MPGTPKPRCAAALSTAPSSTEAAARAAAPILEELGNYPDALVAFFTDAHLATAGELLEELHKQVSADTILGCSARGVMAGSKEVENGPGLALWGVSAPGSRVQSFSLEFEREVATVVKGWPDVDRSVSVALLADPHTFPAAPFLESLVRANRAPNLFGGLASAGHGPGENRMFRDGDLLDEGAVGLVLDGPSCFRPIVSQGCRPVGPRFLINEAEENVIYQMGGARAYEGLTKMLAALNDEEQACFRNAPQLGLLALDAPQETGVGDYLIRGIMGADQSRGSVVVGERVSAGQTVQFHIKDAPTASRELQNLLGLAAALGPEPCGGLAFSCTGRGQNLFGTPGHDATAIQDQFPQLPVAGMFAAGEIGPIGAVPQIHGFSVSLALLAPR